MHAHMEKVMVTEIERGGRRKKGMEQGREGGREGGIEAGRYQQ